jgi:hypothetical protein
LNDECIRGAQHCRLAALIAEHREAPAGFVLINSLQFGGVGDKSCHFPTEPMSLLAIAGAHVSRANEGSNRAEPPCLIIAGIALPPIGCYGFRAAQSAEAVGDDDARIKEHAVD